MQFCHERSEGVVIGSDCVFRTINPVRNPKAPKGRTDIHDFLCFNDLHLCEVPICGLLPYVEVRWFQQSIEENWRVLVVVMCLY